MIPDASLPLVSLVVRTKDRPALLLRALRSVAAQTHRPIEVVVVNDGGQPLDDAALRAALGSVTLQHHRLDHNQGRARAANVGIGLARGRYIGFLDDDDALYPPHVQSLVAVLTGENAAVAYADVEMVTQARSEDGQSFVDLHTSLFSTDFSYAQLLVSNFIPFNALLFDAQVLRDAQGLDESFELYEDWDLLIRVASRHRFVHLRQATARYHQWSTELQINHANAEHMHAATQRILAKHHTLLTPERVLQYRTLRDEHDARLRDTIAQTGQHAHDLEVQLAEREALVVQRDQQLAQREQQLAQAQAQAAANADEARRHEALSNARDAHIHHIEAELHLAHAKFQGELQERQRHIAQLTADIAALRATLGWRALESLRRLLQRTLPRGSIRRRLFDLLLATVLVVRSEGWGSALHKAGRTLARWRARAAQLAGAAVRVYRQDGAAAVLARARAHLARRAQPPAAEAHTAAAAGAAGPAHGPLARTSDRYRSWMQRHETATVADTQRVLDGLQQRPLISIITPVYNVEARWLDRCVESVLAQQYPHWELCLHDDASTRDDTRQALQRWAMADARISVSMGEANQGISGASNTALARARGSFIALLDHDDELTPDALLEVARLLDEHPDTDLVYSDEDRITVAADGSTVRHDPFFKPDWSPRLLFACMYTGHLSVYRKAVVDELGGFRSTFDFSQDYDLALRVTERSDRIRHLPKVLYHWRTLPESAAGGGKDHARVSNIAALQSACDRRGHKARVLALPHANRAVFELPVPAPHVSIIIPTDSRQNVFNCIRLLLQHTDYPAFDIVVVTNSALADEVLQQHAGEPRVSVARFDRPFNFSLKCNVGVQASRGEYVLFYNDDVEAIDGRWLHDMVNAFGPGGVGAVSPRLFYENDTIQYAGMITGVRGMIGTAFHTVHKDSGTYFNFVQSEREVSLASGACMLMPRTVFDEVGGFDAERTPIMHSDADLSLRIRQAGYALVYTPYAALRHIGHLSLKDSDDDHDRRKDKADLYLLKRWGEELSRDPYHPANMTELLYHRGDVPYAMWARRQDDASLAGKDLLLVSHDLTLSGAPILLVYLAEHFRAQGWFVTVMSPHDGELADTLRAQNIPVIVDATLDSEPDPLTEKLMAAFDLVVANTIAAWPAVLAAKRSQTPVLWVLHESHDGRRLVDEQPRVAQALAAADDVVFACEFTRSLYAPFDRAGNFRVMPYGARALQAEAAPRSDGRVRIVHIGSIERRKGQDVFLDALARLPADCVAQLDVVMIGRPLRPDFLQGIRPKLDALHFVTYLGQLPHAQIAGHVAAADIFVSSSRDEVFPVTILEAMSLGRPVVATAVGGVPEMLRDGVDGLVVPSEDSAALAQAMQRLVASADLRQTMGAAAQQRFAQQFTVDKLGDRLLDIIRQRA